MNNGKKYKQNFSNESNDKSDEWKISIILIYLYIYIIYLYIGIDDL